MSRWSPYGSWIFVGWTVVLWISRLRNVLVDDDLSRWGVIWRVGVVVVFVALAVWAGLRLRAGDAVALGVLVVWTLGYWLVRGVGILAGDWDLGFKVVHTVLWVVSAGLAVLAWRSVESARAGARRR